MSKPRFVVLSSLQRIELMEKLESTYGISEVSGTLLKFGEDKVRLFTGSVSVEVLESLSSSINLDILGLYLCKLEKDGVRLSHDATTLLSDQIKKNIINLNKSQVKEYLMGHDVLLTDVQIKEYDGQKGFFVLRNESDDTLMGCGKLGTDGRVRNFVPKERRLKK